MVMIRIILLSGNGSAVENNMIKNNLIINIGSSSKKYHLYKGVELITKAHFEREGDGFVVTYNSEETKKISHEEYFNALAVFCDNATERDFLNDDSSISLIGIRVVSPGEYFTENRIVDDEYLKNLSVMTKRDLAHIGPVQTELENIRKLFPDTKTVAVSDSAFHSTMPQVAKIYSLPQKISIEKDVYRFGFHGISIAGVVHNLKSKNGQIESNVIVCHLGSGASITALRDGQSVDTSMGYSPLEGIMMSSRIGNIDAGAVLYLAESFGLSDLHRIFYSESGLLGLSDLSDDMRVLLDKEKEGHTGAHLAVESFVYNIRKYIGAYASVLGGLDALVFSGTIGERSFILRERICKELEYLNVKINPVKNKSAKSGDDISDVGIRVYVVNGDESEEILRKSLEVVE